MATHCAHGRARGASTVSIIVPCNSPIPPSPLDDNVFRPRSGCTSTAATAAGSIAHIDAGDAWRSAWDADRQRVLSTRRTGSHGMSIDMAGVDGASSSAPLSAWHTGPWTVLPLDMQRQPQLARMPFEWVVQALRQMQTRGSPAAFPTF